MKVIVTGGIGSGKSIALDYFKNVGFWCVKADDVAHELLADEKVKATAVELYGTDILKNNAIDRKTFGKYFFADKSKKLKYEAVVHPMIQKSILAMSAQHTRLAVEIPLLYEVMQQNPDAYKTFDWVIAIEAQQDIIMERILKRDNRNEKQIEQIIGAQVDANKRMEIADVVFINEQSVQALHNKIKNWLEER